MRNQKTGSDKQRRLMGCDHPSLGAVPRNLSSLRSIGLSASIRWRVMHLSKAYIFILTILKLKALAHEFSLHPFAQVLSFTFMLSQFSYFLLFLKREDTLCWQGFTYIYCCIKICHITSLLTLSFNISMLFVKLSPSKHLPLC